MILRVLYLGGLRDLVTGVRAEEVEVGQPATLADVVKILTARHPGLNAHLDSLRLAVNEDLVTADHLLGPGDEVAMLPPVAGGAEQPGSPHTEASRCHLTPESIDVGEVVRAVLSPAHGAVVTFVGLVRQENAGRAVVRLEYEAYRSMAIRSLNEIVHRCEQLNPGARVAVTHRTGVLEIGDIAVAIAVGSPHRAEAFEACRLCIELLKQETPIWKREMLPDGTFWIGVRS